MNSVIHRGYKHKNEVKKWYTCIYTSFGNWKIYLKIRKITFKSKKQTKTKVMGYLNTDGLKLNIGLINL
jgi:hypothetical protein